MNYFKDTKIAFNYRTNKQLKLANLLFTTIKYPVITDIGSGLVNFAIKVHLPVMGLIKNTVFTHFCGGETLKESEKVVQKLKENQVYSVMDYSVEGKSSEKDFDRVMNETLSLVDFNVKEKLPFIVFKPTGVGRFELFQKITEGKKLNIKEEAEFERVKIRFHKIIKKAIQQKIKVMIDAEESWMQDAADDLIIELMQEYNKEQAWVYNTLQMYRHDRLAYLKKIHSEANRAYKLAFKIVRGAYMEKERERAEEKEYPSPIQPNKEASDRDYDAAIIYMIKNIEDFGLYAGTHNEKSVTLFIDLIKEKGIELKDDRLWLGQLYAMSDHISFNAAKLGYNVSKYLPYGPVKDVVPYLIRRAKENTSVAGQTGRELSLIKEELERRK